MDARIPLKAVLNLAVLAAAVSGLLATSGKPVKSNCANGQCRPCPSSMDGAVANFCSYELKGSPIGAPEPLARVHLDTVRGIYAHFADLDAVLETGSLRTAGSSVYVDVVSGGLFAMGIPHVRQQLSWKVPVAGSDAFQEVLSGVFYFPFSASFNRVMAANSAQIEAANFGEMHLYFQVRTAGATNPAGASPWYGFEHGLGKSEEAADTSAAGFTVDDARTILRGHAAGSVSYAVFHLSMPVSPDLKLDEVMVVQDATTGEALKAGWSLGPDRRLLLLAFIADGQEVQIRPAAGFVSKDGKPFVTPGNPRTAADGISFYSERSGDDPAEDEP